MPKDLVVHIAVHEILHGFGMLDRKAAFHAATLFTALEEMGHRLPPDETNMRHIDVSAVALAAANTALCAANWLRLGFQPQPVKIIKDLIKSPAKKPIRQPGNDHGLNHAG
jgi:hypothetical protein